jgi:hypothetical protein
MGIDGVGKKGGPKGVDGTSNEAKPVGDGAKFDPTQAASPDAPVKAADPLERFHSGEIDLNGYLDEKVLEATEHLGALLPRELAAVRAMLREQLESDPSLLALVKQATGPA